MLIMKKEGKTTKILGHLLTLLTCALMLMAVVIQRDGRTFGHDLLPAAATTDTVITHRPDGTLVLDTRTITRDIIGYGGPIPLRILLADGVVTDIDILDNAETPSFLTAAQSVISGWIGLTPAEALAADVDAISGATFSSSAIIASVRRGMEYAIAGGISRPSLASQFEPWATPGFIASLIVILAGAILPLFFKNKIYRIIQLTLNVIVLGFWCGTFLNYTMILNFFSNGINVIASFITLLLLVVAFIYPLFGKKNHYCLWLCPLGSIQELAGKTVKYKLPISTRLLRALGYARQALWAVLMLLMWSGVYFSWIDYELFSAFLFGEAAIGIVIAGILLVLLSVVVNRPYCRFICPTGTLLSNI